MKRALRMLRRWRVPIFYALVIWTAISQIERGRPAWAFASGLLLGAVTAFEIAERRPMTTMALWLLDRMHRYSVGHLQRRIRRLEEELRGYRIQDEAD